MFKRRKLGSANVKSPSQEASSVIANNMLRFFFSIFLSFCFLVALYFIVSIINFLGSEITGLWEKDLETSHLFNHPYCLPVKIIGMICAFFYVFRDNLRKR